MTRIGFAVTFEDWRRRVLLAAAMLALTAFAASGVEAAGVPSRVVATASGATVTARVTDAAGANVADGTPVRFTTTANGEPSTACMTSEGGAATLVQASGTVVVTVDYNESGAAATCANPGTSQIVTSVTVGGAPPPPPPSGAGTFASPPVYSSGTTKLALVVFNGGTVAQLDAALVSVNASGAWAQTSTGAFALYIVGAPVFANDPFRAAFPNGFAGVTSLTLVGK